MILVHTRTITAYPLTLNSPNDIELADPLNVRANSREDKCIHLPLNASKYIRSQRRRAFERSVVKYPIAVSYPHHVASFTVMSNEFSSRSSSSLDNSSCGDVRWPQIVPLVDDVEEVVDLLVNQAAVDFNELSLNQSSRRRLDVRVVDVRQVDSRETTQCSCADLTAPLSLPVPQLAFDYDSPDVYIKQDRLSSASAAASFSGEEEEQQKDQDAYTRTLEPTERHICWHHMRVTRSRRTDDVHFRECLNSTPDWRKSKHDEEEELLHDESCRLFCYSFCERYVDPAFSDAVRPTVIDETLPRLLRRRFHDMSANAVPQSQSPPPPRTQNERSRAQQPMPTTYWLRSRQSMNRVSSGHTGLPGSPRLPPIVRDSAGRRQTSDLSRQSPTFGHAGKTTQEMPSSPLLRASDLRPSRRRFSSSFSRLPPLPSPSALIRIRILESRLRFARDTHSERGIDIFEDSGLLRYESNPFEWTVRLQVEALETRGNWCIGFVQSCVAMHCENVYGSAGSSWWEFHELSHGRRAFLNDSDGTVPPFYGGALGQQLVKIWGPRGALRDYEESDGDDEMEGNEDLQRNEFQTTADRQNAASAQLGRPFTLQMHDCFTPAISWDRPIRYLSGPEADWQVPALTAVRRSQRFIVWLALYDCERHTWFGLKTVKWNYVLEMTVDTRRPLGGRVHVVRNEPHCEALQKEDADGLVRIPPDALMPPFANACQSLVWRPRHAPNCTQKSRDRRHSSALDSCECNLQPVLVVRPTRQLATWKSWKHEMLLEPQRGPLDSTKRVGECPFVGSRWGNWSRS